eukprot:m.436760 g.436760  ORF g.436760 m.436760 type:complete len:764 (-) comp56777_c0_seq4:1124-3415(-)
MGGNGSTIERAELGSVIDQFVASYLGSVPVKHSMGNDICADAVTRVLALKQAAKNVQLLVTAKGVYILDGKSGETIKEAPINEVTFVSLDPIDKKLFSYITKSASLDLTMCHVFNVKTRAQDFPLAINQAFQVLAGKVDASQAPLKRRLSKKEAFEAASEQRVETNTRPTDPPLKTLVGQYLGSVAVSQSAGDDVLEDATKRIKALNAAVIDINIMVFPKDIEIINAKTKELIKGSSIFDVSYIRADPASASQVAFITSDRRLGLKYCHIFKMQDSGADVVAVVSETLTAATAKLAAESGSSQEAKELLQQGGDEKKTGEVLGVFEAKFLGFTTCEELQGNPVVAACVDTVLAQKLPESGVLLMMSSEGIRVVDALTEENIRTVFIKNISYTTVTGKTNNIFAFITNDERLGRTTCHLFLAGGKAYDIAMMVGKAFEVAAEEAKKLEGSPFAAIQGESRQAVEGVLHKKQVHRRELTPIKAIGAGQFGQVYLATYAPEGQEKRKVAVKMLRGGASAADKIEFLRECETMLDLDNESLVRMIGVAVQQRPWLCVIEFMQFGDLRDVVQTCFEKSCTLTELEQVILASSICSGMEFVASKRLVHMDLAARNVLLTGNNIAKVADFGLTRPLTPGLDHFVLKGGLKLPVKWMALEALEGFVFSEKSDVWSFGITVWEIMAYGEMPYREVKPLDIFRKLKDGLRLEKPFRVSPDFWDTTKSCWIIDRAARPNFATLSAQLEVQKTKLAKMCPAPRNIGELASKKKTK